MFPKKELFRQFIFNRLIFEGGGPEGGPTPATPEKAEGADETKEAIETGDAKEKAGEQAEGAKVEGDKKAVECERDGQKLANECSERELNLPDVTKAYEGQNLEAVENREFEAKMKILEETGMVEALGEVKAKLLATLYHIEVDKDFGQPIIMQDETIGIPLESENMENIVGLLPENIDEILAVLEGGEESKELSRRLNLLNQVEIEGKPITEIFSPLELKILAATRNIRGDEDFGDLIEYPGGGELELNEITEAQLRELMPANVDQIISILPQAQDAETTGTEVAENEQEVEPMDPETRAKVEKGVAILEGTEVGQSLTEAERIALAATLNIHANEADTQVGPLIQNEAGEWVTLKEAHPEALRAMLPNNAEELYASFQKQESAEQNPEGGSEVASASTEGSSGEEAKGETVAELSPEQKEARIDQAANLIFNQGIDARVRIMKFINPNIDENQVGSMSMADFNKALKENEALSQMLSGLEVTEGQTQLSEANQQQLDDALATSLGVNQVERAEAKEVKELRDGLSKKIQEKLGKDGLTILSMTHEIKDGKIKVADIWQELKTLNEEQVMNLLPPNLQKAFGEEGADIEKAMKESLGELTNALAIKEQLSGKEGGKLNKGKQTIWEKLVVFAEMIMKYKDRYEKGDTTVMAEISRGIKDYFNEGILPAEGEERAQKYYAQIATNLKSRGDIKGLMELYKNPKDSKEVGKDVGYYKQGTDAAKKALAEMVGTEEMEVKSDGIVYGSESNQKKLMANQGVNGIEVKLYQLNENGQPIGYPATGTFQSMEEIKSFASNPETLIATAVEGDLEEDEDIIILDDDEEGNEQSEAA